MQTEVRYSHLTPSELRRRREEAPIAYLPLGTLEWHGEHLPLGADGLQSSGFFQHLAREVGGVVLPMLFLGPDITAVHDGREFYGMDVVGFPDQPPQQLEGSAYHIPDQIFDQLVEQTLKQLRRAGFRVVMAHGHGPSIHRFTEHIPRWEQQLNLRLFTAWSGEDAAMPGLQTDHAAANETSLTMFLYPHLVHMENLDNDPNTWPLGVAGRDPRFHASAEHGQELVEYHSHRLAVLLRNAIKELQR